MSLRKSLLVGSNKWKEVSTRPRNKIGISWESKQGAQEGLLIITEELLNSWDGKTTHPLISQITMASPEISKTGTILSMMGLKEPDKWPG